MFTYASWHPDSFKKSYEILLRDAFRKNVRKKLCKTDVLVIDEISMVEPDLFIRLDAVMREARHGWKDVSEPQQRPVSAHTRWLPFGGCQVIVTGDFCQLPPVKPHRFCLHCGGDELPGWKEQAGPDLSCRKCRRTYTDADSKCPKFYEPTTRNQDEE